MAAPVVHGDQRAQVQMAEAQRPRLLPPVQPHGHHRGVRPEGGTSGRGEDEEVPPETGDGQRTGGEEPGILKWRWGSLGTTLSLFRFCIYTLAKACLFVSTVMIRRTPDGLKTPDRAPPGSSIHPPIAVGITIAFRNFGATNVPRDWWSSSISFYH